MYYVTMTDKFMSGWGMAQGLTNKLIFECPTADDAYRVENNARARGDMKYIHVCSTRPKYYRATENPAGYQLGSYYVQIKTAADYPSWYR